MIDSFFIFQFFLIFFLSVVFSYLGIGGASIYTPLFIILGLSIEESIFLSLFLNILTSLTSLLHFFAFINFQRVIPLIAGSLFGAFLGAKLFFIINKKLILFLLSLFLFYSALSLLRNHIKVLEISNDFSFKIASFFFSSHLMIFFLGFLLSTLSGLIGIGGGIILVPLLILLNEERTRAIAYSMLFVFFSSLIAFLTFLSQFQFNVSFIPLGFASILGSFFGSRIVTLNIIDNKKVNLIYAFILLLFSLKLFIDFLDNSW